MARPWIQGSGERSPGPGALPHPQMEEGAGVRGSEARTSVRGAARAWGRSFGFPQALYPTENELE